MFRQIMRRRLPGGKGQNRRAGFSGIIRIQTVRLEAGEMQWLKSSAYITALILRVGTLSCAIMGQFGGAAG
jgi:hypothetical protein